MNSSSTQSSCTNQEPAPVDVCEALFQILRDCHTKEDLYRQAVRLLAVHFDAPFAIIRVENSPASLEERVQWSESAGACWRGRCDELLLSAHYEGLAKAKLYKVDSLDTRFAVLAAPVSDLTQGTVGSIAIVTPCNNKELAEALLIELKSLIGTVSALGANVPAGTAAASPIEDSSSSMARASGYRSLQEFAFAIANNLKGKLGCEQVCIGLVKRNRVKLLCMSGFDNLYPRSPGTQLVEQAMAECLDAGQTICYQAERRESDGQSSTGHRLHKQWYTSAGSAPVASIPLIADQQCVAVLSIRSPVGQSLNPEELQQISNLVTPLAPGLMLLERANLSLMSHAADSSRRVIKRWFSNGAWGRKLLALSLLAFCGWLIFGKCQYAIVVPCEIAPSQVRHIAAPFEGTIDQSLVKPGDVVEENQLLARMYMGDLEVERGKLLAELKIAGLEMTQAATAKDVSAAAQARARMEIAKSKLATVDYRLSRAEIRAPAAGTILQGDLRPRVGQVVPLGEPLLQFAPQQGWDLELHVPEYAAAHLRPGQQGEFTTNARPDEAAACQLDRIDPASAVVDGKNGFTARAKLGVHSAEWQRVGMRGVARINVGKRPVWWVWFHRAVDSVRLQLWKL